MATTPRVPVDDVAYVIYLALLMTGNNYRFLPQLHFLPLDACCTSSIVTTLCCEFMQGLRVKSVHRLFDTLAWQTSSHQSTF